MLNKNNLNRGIRPKMGKKSGGSLSGIAPKKTNNPFGRTNARRGTAGIIGKSTQSAFSQNVYGQGNSSEEVDKVSDVKIQIPLKIKLIIIGIVLVISLVMFIVAIFVIIFTGGEEEATVGSSNGDTYYATPKCTNVTLTYTGCDESGENCNVNDGETTFENYIAGTVAAEAGNIENEEYYKLLAITTRTKFYNQYKGNDTINCGTDNSLCSKYMNVEDSPNSEKIKQAVASTEGYVFVENNKIAKSNVSDACVVNADNQYYYIRYGRVTLGEPEIQQIPKEWDNTLAASGSLGRLYDLVDKNNIDYTNKSCPENNDFGMSMLGALYLITEQNYSHEQVLKYYYDNIETKSINTMSFANVVNGFINPVNSFSCTSGFGCRMHPIYKQYKYHEGVDLGASSGEPVYATKSGTITSIVKNVPGYKEHSYGNYMTISHEDGSSTRYAHLLYNSIPNDFEVGTVVTQGQMIGKVGSTGTSTGPHLHYELYVNGQRVNPANYMDLSSQKSNNKCSAGGSVDLSYCGL